jgi:hypothetical protein
MAVNLLRKWRQGHHGILDIQICRGCPVHTCQFVWSFIPNVQSSQTAALIVHVLPYTVVCKPVSVIHACAYYDSIHRRAARYLPRSYSTDTYWNVSTTPCALLHMMLKEFGNSKLRALLGIVRFFGSEKNSTIFSFYITPYDSAPYLSRGHNIYDFKFKYFDNLF